ncbi:MAG: Deoxyguanosinetriphosphate triphosphohydrolase [Chloroflexi bacterium]|nr:Deoxyguanosinetriphosphate triphosphohydrolase [Chloroflexota bacterium]
MTWTLSADERYKRLADDPWKPHDDRRGDEAQRDRDRILYSSAFRRLAEVTQVVSPSGSQVFHNRLTHSLKVAQVGRALAALFQQRGPADLIEVVGGIDPTVVEAASLAHDLGHPPFGHLAEHELCMLLEGQGVEDGFEGNAQSFRIVTRLSVHTADRKGLNLTKAALHALLKYPCMRGESGKNREKYGAYEGERDIFEEIRPPDNAAGAPRSVEASLMDWADDVTYSVHDMEDFYRAGLIPLHRLARPGREQDLFLENAVKRLRDRGWDPGRYPDEQLRQAFTSVVTSSPVIDAYTGTHRQRAGLRTFTSQLTSRFIHAARLVEPQAGVEDFVAIDLTPQMEVAMLKELTWEYVITNPALTTQQIGQRRVIRELFTIYMDAASTHGQQSVFPAIYQDYLREVGEDEHQHARIVADLISGLTEDQALRLYRRFSGADLGAVLDQLAM